MVRLAGGRMDSADRRCGGGLATTECKTGYGRSAVDHRCLVLDKGKTSRHPSGAGMHVGWRRYPSRMLATTGIAVTCGMREAGARLQVAESPFFSPGRVRSRTTI